MRSPSGSHSTFRERGLPRRPNFYSFFPVNFSPTVSPFPAETHTHTQVQREWLFLKPVCPLFPSLSPCAYVYGTLQPGFYVAVSIIIKPITYTCITCHHPKAPSVSQSPFPQLIYPTPPHGHNMVRQSIDRCWGRPMKRGGEKGKRGRRQRATFWKSTFFVKNFFSFIFLQILPDTTGPSNMQQQLFSTGIF